MASFLWKLLHQLLSSQERLHRLGVSSSSLCKQCKQEVGTLKHELIECSSNADVGVALLNCLKSYMPELTADKLLRLEFSKISETMELAATLLVAVTLSHIWKERMTNSRIRTYQVRSEIEQTINLLRTTRLINTAISLETLATAMFH